MSVSPPGVPAHLPRRLAICGWFWEWLVLTRPGEAYHDLDRAVAEARERGYNCVRVDSGAFLAFDAQGRRRGPVTFREWAPGYSTALINMQGHGGVPVDVLDRVLRLFDALDAHDMYAILSSWMFQDFIEMVDGAALRDEIIGTPYEERLAALARQQHLVLTALRERGLLHRVAFCEVLNEIEYVPLVGQPRDGHARPTYDEFLDECNFAKPPAVRAALRQRAGEAVAYLRERHPDVLITIDLGHHGALDLVPDNAQVLDCHAYNTGITYAPLAAMGTFGGGLDDGGDPLAHPELAAVVAPFLRPDAQPWAPYIAQARHWLRRQWRTLTWLYHNMDLDYYDRWCLEHFAEIAPAAQEKVAAHLAAAAEAAARLGLPLVMDEGFLFFPPLFSRFPTTRQAQSVDEEGVEAALALGYWGIMPGTHMLPGSPLWRDAGMCEWIRDLNARIRNA